MRRATTWAVLAATLAVTFAISFTASAATISTIRVRLHPYTAPGGTFPPDAQAKLEALAGTGLTFIGTTRTGALDLALAQPQDSTAIAATLKALRNDRGVLWAESPRAASASVKAAPMLPGADQPGKRLMVRLKDGVAPDWATLLARFAGSIEPTGLSAAIGNVWVLSAPLPYPPSQLAQMA
jgi:hypothetical protein